ncbi:MAG: hypothetical protein EBU88_10155 [Acidobacteria bacterium]|nr:hypothetical protein [Acidobacteriota bacterium]
MPPGREGFITLNISTSGYAGPIKKSAEVITNDPQNARFSLTVRLDIVDDETPSENQIGPFFIAPATRWKGTTGQGMSVVGLMTLSNRSNPLIRIREIKHSADAMTVKLNVLSTGRRYTLQIRSRLDLPVGIHRQSVTLVTDSPTTPELKLELELEVTP